MLTDDKKRLQLLVQFETDHNTAKHQKQEFDQYVISNSTFYGTGGSIMDMTPDQFMFGNSSEFIWDGLDFPHKKTYKSNWGKLKIKSYIKLKKLFRYKKQTNALVFFDNIKKSINEIKNVDSHIEELNKIIETLKGSGQKELYEIAKVKRHVFQAEKSLVKVGFNKYLSEEDIVRFVKQSKRGLRLDYIKNFNRIIPSEVIESKNNVEKAKAFDNFLILHYDPDMSKNIDMEMVQEEKKDPILFGVIKSSNRLYFVDDWIDEKCDLTYQKLINEIGIKEKTIE